MKIYSSLWPKDEKFDVVLNILMFTIVIYITLKYTTIWILVPWKISTWSASVFTADVEEMSCTVDLYDDQQFLERSSKIFQHRLNFGHRFPFILVER